MTPQNKIIVDIVGLPGSGKSAVCELLCQKYGFTMFRPSDALRQYAKEHGIALHSRQDYIDCHAALNQDDPLAIVKPVIASPARLICLDGMRAPAPFKRLHEAYGAKLIVLDCPVQVRYQRTVADITRAEHRSLPSLEAFKADEAPDLTNDDPNLPNMSEMQRMADATINASQPFDAVMRDIEAFLASIGALPTRP